MTALDKIEKILYDLSEDMEKKGDPKVNEKLSALVETLKLLSKDKEDIQIVGIFRGILNSMFKIYDTNSPTTEVILILMNKFNKEFGQPN